MGSTRIIKQTRPVTPRVARATPPSVSPGRAPSGGASRTKANAVAPRRRDGGNAQAPAGPESRAAKAPLARAPSSSFDLSAFQNHDEAASAALRQCRAAWLSDADAARARDRFYELARRSKRVSLLVCASLATLVRDQARLAKLGVPHLLFQGGEARLGRAESEALRRGGPLAVLLPSEALAHAEVHAALGRAELGAIAIDGAELASDGGHELRPSFALLSERLAPLSAASRFALARPVKAEVRRQAQARLGLADAPVLQGALVAPTVRLEARAVRGERRNATLLELLPSLPERGVILCATPHEVDGLCAVLGKEHGNVYRVHSGMPYAERHAMSERFDADSSRALLITTSAFGPDAGVPGLGETAASEPRPGFGADLVPGRLHFVLHHHAPASLEQYVRELALLSPGGNEALALLFYDSSHRSMNQAILEQLRLPWQKLEAFARVLEATLGGGRPLKPEALALQTGVSRRTSERLLALLLDAGLARSEKGAVLLEKTDAKLAAGVEALAHALERLQRDDGARLAAVECYAESPECKRRVLGQYFGRALEGKCGRCSGCRPHATAERHAHAR